MALGVDHRAYILDNFANLPADLAEADDGTQPLQLQEAPAADIGADRAEVIWEQRVCWLAMFQALGTEVNRGLKPDQFRQIRDAARAAVLAADMLSGAPVERKDIHQRFFEHMTPGHFQKERQKFLPSVRFEMLSRIVRHRDGAYDVVPYTTRDEQLTALNDMHRATHQRNGDAAHKHVAKKHYPCSRAWVRRANKDIVDTCESCRRVQSEPPDVRPPRSIVAITKATMTR